MSVTEDLLSKLVEHQVIANQVIAQLYTQVQAFKADETPGDWKAYCVSVGGDQTSLILGSNPRRKTLYVYNNGTNAVLLASMYFDGPSADTAITNIITGQMVPCITLASSSSIKIDTTGGLYGYSKGASLDIVENLYKTNVRQAANGDEARKEDDSMMTHIAADLGLSGVFA